MKRILVACEFSGVVRRAFTVQGWDAYSCDLLPAEDGARNHFQGNVLELLKGAWDGVQWKTWDLMIAHPPCTYLTCTGNRWFKPEYRDRFPTRETDREEAIEFFKQLYNASIPHICIENPVGIMSRFQKPTQIIQPYQFGHLEAKKTCLWLQGLPLLNPTKLCEPEYVTFKSGKRMAKWYADAWSMPKEERTRIRNRTFEGIADAMAIQWTSYLQGDQ